MCSNAQVTTRAMQKTALVVGTAALVLVAYQRGAFAAFGDPARLKATLLQLGPRGYVVYLIAVALLQPLGVPGVMFIVVASLLWPPPVAMALSLTACTISSVIGFSFARYLARDWVEKKIPPRLRKYDERLETHGFVTVLLLRSLMWMNPILHALLGISRVRFSTHLLATILAYIVPVVALTYLGDAAFSVLKNQPPERWLELGVMVALALAAYFVVRRRRKPRTELS